MQSNEIIDLTASDEEDVKPPKKQLRSGDQAGSSGSAGGGDSQRAGFQLTPNYEDFVCSLCETFIEAGEGIALRNCQHNFCMNCLTNHIAKQGAARVLCPLKIEKCDKAMPDDEIQGLLSINHGHDRMETSMSLLELYEKNSHVVNKRKFNCSICLSDIVAGDGITLMNCLHEFCKICLVGTIEHSEELEVACPFIDNNDNNCFEKMQDREIRSLLSQRGYEIYLQKSLDRAEATTARAFHCKQPDCVGWAEAGEDATIFACQVCLQVNCIKCKAIHEGRTCRDYFFEINADARKAHENEETEKHVKEMFAQQLAMPCPSCGVLIQKNQGCNHMKCSRCKTDFQWFGLK